MHITALGVNDAYDLVAEALCDGQREPSRNGDVVRLYGPTTVTYIDPRQRVLFGRGRNPFFHVYESIWMLAGRKDVNPLLQFIRDFDRYADKGGVVWDAYGYRWRNWFHVDQIAGCITQLKRNPKTRRCVLQIWDGQQDFNRELHHPNNVAVPCNLCVVFQETDGALDMTVFNRSNDAIWGMLGANMVHFSFLHEVVAYYAEMPMGAYHQITANCHTYKEPIGDRWTGPYGDKAPVLPEGTYRDFIELCEEWSNDPHDETGNTFLDKVAFPMMLAHQTHKEGDTKGALHCMEHHCIPCDWQKAGIEWLSTRA